jgi:hypothetical protein
VERKSGLGNKVGKGSEAQTGARGHPECPKNGTRKYMQSPDERGIQSNLDSCLESSHAKHTYDINSFHLESKKPLQN